VAWLRSDPWLTIPKSATQATAADIADAIESGAAAGFPRREG
jgi:hypothetical protein